MRLLPAPAGSGIVFRRTDLDNFEIPATGRNVAKVSYATSLMRQGVLISTTEHLLSALIGMGVDNVIVELDNLELPILDGSAQPYVEAFLSAGIQHPAPPPRIHPRPQARRGPRRRQVHRRLPRRRLQHHLRNRLSRSHRLRNLLCRPRNRNLRRRDRRCPHLRLQSRRAKTPQHGPHPRSWPQQRHHPHPQGP